MRCQLSSAAGSTQEEKSSREDPQFAWPTFASGVGSWLTASLSAAARRHHTKGTIDPLAPHERPFTWKHAQPVADSPLLKRDIVVAHRYDLLRRERWTSPGSYRGS